MRRLGHAGRPGGSAKEGGAFCSGSGAVGALRRVRRKAMVLGRMRGLLAAGTGFLAKTVTVAEVEARKLRHDPVELFTRAVQPTLWLLVFGQVFSRVRAIPTGQLRYLDFMAPGILAQSVLFVAIFYGISVIWERDLGMLHKFLVTPSPRGALVLGKALSAGLRGLSQAAIVYLLALLLGVRLNSNPLAALGVLLMVVLGSALFSTLSLIIACLVKTRERFMGIGQVLTMPLFFASNAIYPVAMMPGWLQVVSRVNPLTYQVDALRGLMLAGGVSSLGLGLDIGVAAAVTVALVVVAARLYPTIVS
ncbi:MAG: ABC transporter permease [Acetobacteraceae bacterium]|nr:ABC transporter permease [Acetobacteraceae bacterium]